MNSITLQNFTTDGYLLRLWVPSTNSARRCSFLLEQYRKTKFCHFVENRVKQSIFVESGVVIFISSQFRLFLKNKNLDLKSVYKSKSYKNIKKTISEPKQSYFRPFSQIPHAGKICPKNGVFSICLPIRHLTQDSNKSFS